MEVLLRRDRRTNVTVCFRCPVGVPTPHTDTLTQRTHWAGSAVDMAAISHQSQQWGGVPVSLVCMLPVCTVQTD